MRPSGDDAKNVNCETCQSLLVDYAYGELDATEAARVEEALTRCPECVVELAELRSVMSAYERLERPALPTSMRDAILREANAAAATMAAGGTEERRPAGVLVFLRSPVFGAMAAAALVAVVGAWMLRSGFSAKSTGSGGGEAEAVAIAPELNAEAAAADPTQPNAAAIERADELATGTAPVHQISDDLLRPPAVPAPAVNAPELDAALQEGADRELSAEEVSRDAVSRGTGSRGSGRAGAGRGEDPWAATTGSAQPDEITNRRLALGENEPEPNIATNAVGFQFEDPDTFAAGTETGSADNEDLNDQRAQGEGALGQLNGGVGGFGDVNNGGSASTSGGYPAAALEDRGGEAELAEQQQAVETEQVRSGSGRQPRGRSAVERETVQEQEVATTNLQARNGDGIARTDSGGSGAGVRPGAPAQQPDTPTPPSPRQPSAASNNDDYEAPSAADDSVVARAEPTEEARAYAEADELEEEAEDLTGSNGTPATTAWSNGMAAYRAGSYSNAVSELSIAARSLPSGTREHEDSLYFLGMAQMRLDMYDSADRWLARYLEAYPGGRYASSATEARAEISESGAGSAPMRRANERDQHFDMDMAPAAEPLAPSRGH